MYGNYYLRRIADHPLARRNKVVPVTNLSHPASVNEMRDTVQTREIIKLRPKEAGHKHQQKHVKKRRTLKEIARLVIIAIRFSKAASYRKDGWIREVHGGVKMWVNQHTREVSLESPWTLDLNIVKKNTKILQPIKQTLEKKSKRLSLTQRFSMIFFGTKKQVEDTAGLTLVKEYSHISTSNVTRQSSTINDDIIHGDNDHNNDHPTSEIEELIKMFDEEMKKKKSLLL